MVAVTVTKLVARIREQTDMVGSDFVTDAQDSIYNWINQAHSELHGMVVGALGEEYLSTYAGLTTIAGTESYALPSDFYKLYGIELDHAGRTYTLQPFNRNAGSAYRNSSTNSRYGAFAVPSYRLVGPDIQLLPVPQQVFTGNIYYAPEATVLQSGSSINYPNGWERFIIFDAAIKVLMKEESDTRELVRERDRVVKEIELAKETRDLANPHRVVDMYESDFNGDY